MDHVTRTLAAKLQRCPTSFRTRIYRSLGDITFTLHHAACISSFRSSSTLSSLFPTGIGKSRKRERDREKVTRISEKIFRIKISMESVREMWLVIQYIISATRMTSDGYLSSYIIDFPRRPINFIFARFYRRLLPLVPPLASPSLHARTPPRSIKHGELCTNVARNVIIPMLNSLSLPSC